MSKWNPPRREVTQTKHVIELDIPARQTGLRDFFSAPKENTP